MPEASPAMVTLRLFRQDAPFRQLEARSFAGGELCIGREPGEGWAIEDPDRTISRRHCSVALRDGILTLTDTSANGVLIGQHRERPPAGEPVALAPGESFRLGGFMILVDAESHETADAPAPPKAAPSLDALEATRIAFHSPFTQPLLQPSPATAADVAVPQRWNAEKPEAARTPASRGDTAAALLDAFCEGAHLEASAFAGEDASVLMRRLGEVYRQMVLGLSDQMTARASLKSDYRLERTTVGAFENNPFKWAPAHRVAVDLLRSRDDGFMEGPEAARASFEDMKKHVLCVLAGMRAVLSETLSALSPEAVEARLGARSFVLTSRDAAAWREYANVHAALGLDAAESRDSAVNRAFREAYDRALRDLDRADSQG